MLSILAIISSVFAIIACTCAYANPAISLVPSSDFDICSTLKVIDVYIASISPLTLSNCANIKISGGIPVISGVSLVLSHGYLTG